MRMKKRMICALALVMLLGGCGKEPDAEETLAQGENVVDETAQNDVNDNA